MNQNRWTCLTTVVLTTVVVPITTVHAKTLTSPVMDGGSYSPLSPKSLPIITPLTVTEIETETEAAIPAAIRPVPKVSKLPMVQPLLGEARTQANRQQPKIAKLESRPIEKLPSQSSVAQRPARVPSFNPNSHLPAPIFVIPNQIDSSVPQAKPVALIHQTTPQPDNTKATPLVTSQTASTQIVVVRSDKAPPTVIEHSATVQAETARLPQSHHPRLDRANPQQPPLANTTTNHRSEINTLPQVTPIVSESNDRADLPNFEAGSPKFVTGSERPRQIVARAIAQIDDESVAPEQSVAIPVERPKQSTIPAQRPVVAPVPSLAQPAETGMVEVEQPAATTQPTLNNIVATHTGKASWYGTEAGSMTANGEKFNPNGLTAAHRTLPFGTKVRVTSMKTGKFVTVRINDRGPFRSQRIIDVSAGAAETIGIKSDGIGEVRMEVLGREG
jgi:rare lipoprotein A